MFCKGFERKEAFLDQKESAQKTTKICLFLKGLVHGFCQKMEILLNFFYAKWIKKKGFVKFMERKEAFLDYKDIG